MRKPTRAEAVCMRPKGGGPKVTSGGGLALREDAAGHEGTLQAADGAALAKAPRAGDGAGGRPGGLHEGASRDRVLSFRLCSSACGTCRTSASRALQERVVPAESPTEFVYRHRCYSAEDSDSRPLP